MVLMVSFIQVRTKEVTCEWGQMIPLTLPPLWSDYPTLQISGHTTRDPRKMVPQPDPAQVERLQFFFVLDLFPGQKPKWGEHPAQNACLTNITFRLLLCFHFSVTTSR